MIELPKHKQLILFDGVCNLCNSTVQYVIKHDKYDVFRFAPLQSDVGQILIAQFQIDILKTDSILLYSEEFGLTSKSTAALRIFKRLGFPNNILQLFFIVPVPVRNWVYDFIARNRYKWYGKRNQCMIPTPELKSKFMK